jgi:hypothetical protein
MTVLAASTDFVLHNSLLDAHFTNVIIRAAGIMAAATYWYRRPEQADGVLGRVCSGLLTVAFMPLCRAGPEGAR